MVKKLCCLLVLTSLVACTPANPPQAIGAGGLHDDIQTNGLGVEALTDD